MKRAVALIDGEHYPSVVREALEEVAAAYDLRAAVFIGGTEKIDSDRDDAGDVYGVKVYMHADAFEALSLAMDEQDPEVVVDLSDEPVLGYRERFAFASRVLARGARYVGADFTLEPPRFHSLSRKPSLAVIGTGKRIGKTAVSGYIAREVNRALLADGMQEGVVVVAMGRGGPPEPEVMPGREESVGPAELLALSRQGRYAASDYLEDAALSSVTTVGCRRCGGGLAGQPYVSNVVEGAELAEGLAADLLIFEGSGAALPPIAADRTICIAAADQPRDYILGYLGTYRILISDLVLLTMCEEPLASAEEVAGLVEGIVAVNPAAEVVTTVLRPAPDGDIGGKRVAYFTTARADVLGGITGHLEEAYDCEVVFASADLADRSRLRAGLAELPAGAVDVFLTEIKAAAVDVVVEEADHRGVEAVFCDNVPVETDGEGRLAALVTGLARRAVEDFQRKAG